jgi:hypothetical protein
VFSLFPGLRHVAVCRCDSHSNTKSDIALLYALDTGRVRRHRHRHRHVDQSTSQPVWQLTAWIGSTFDIMSESVMTDNGDHDWSSQGYITLTMAVWLTTKPHRVARCL